MHFNRDEVNDFLITTFISLEIIKLYIQNETNHILMRNYFYNQQSDQLAIILDFKLYLISISKNYNLKFHQTSNILMGTVKSLAHLNSYNEYLYYYIDRNEVPKIEELLEKKPELIKADLTRNSKTSAINRAAYNGNLELVKLFVQKYKADIDLVAGNGQTPLIAAVKRNHVHIVRYLLQNGANADYKSPVQNLKVVQYAILQGLYEVALLVYEKMKERELRNHHEYREMALLHKYRYVNYKIFLQNLVDMVDPDNTKDFLTKEKIVYQDPVIDPRQTWKQWFGRNLDFRDPPLVQRSSLPEELQPQNRNFAKVRHFMGKLTMSPLAPQVSLKPTNQTQFQESNQAFKGMKGEKIEMQTVS